MRKIEKFGKIIKEVGVILVIFGGIYIAMAAGASDSSYRTIQWILQNALYGALIILLGYGVVKASEFLMNLSHKSFVHVQVINTTNNKIKTVVVEKDGCITLAPNEEIHKVGKKVYYFQ